MKVRAKAMSLRMSPRKARLVADVVRGKPVNEALAMLHVMPQVAARALSKVVASAKANAENNYMLEPDELRVDTIQADEGQTLKRFRPRAHGRVSPILSRSTHITVVLSDKEG